MVSVIVVKVKVMVKEKYKNHDKNESFMNIAEGQILNVRM